MELESPLISKRLRAVEAIVQDHDAWSSVTSVYSALLTLVSAVADLEDAEAPFVLVDSNVPFAEKAQRLVDWMRSHPNFSCKEFAVVDCLSALEGTRGIVLGEAVSKGASVMTIPVDMAVSTQSADLSRELGPLLEQQLLGVRSMPTVSLTLHLMVEHAKCVQTMSPPEGLGMGPHIPLARTDCGRTPEERFADRRQAEAAMRSMMDGGGHSNHRVTELALGTAAGSHPWGSRWRAYLAMLPETTSSCLFWKVEDWAALKGTAVFLSAAFHLRTTLKTFVQLRSMFVSPRTYIKGFEPHFTWAAFRWAMSMVSTRQNRLPLMTGGSTLGLLPLFDMANHAPDAPDVSAGVTMRDGEGPPSLCMDLGAYRSFAAGEEFLHSYGFRPATLLLQYAGFVTGGWCSGAQQDVAPPVLVSLPGGEDKLMRIRINVLTAAEIMPVTHASVECNAASVRIRADIAAKGTPKQRAALDELHAAQIVASFVPEAETWKWPMEFETPVKYDPQTAAERGKTAAEAAAALAVAGGTTITAAPADTSPLLPAELLTFCRAACMDKADAMPLLRLLQAHGEAEKAAVVAAAASGEPHGHSHGDGVACGGHHGGQAEADIGAMVVPALAPETEAAARRMALQAVESSCSVLDSWQGPREGAWRGAVPEVFIRQYRGTQRAMLTRAAAALQ